MRRRKRQEENDEKARKKENDEKTRKEEEDREKEEAHKKKLKEYAERHGDSFAYTFHFFFRDTRGFAPFVRLI